MEMVTLEETRNPGEDYVGLDDNEFLSYLMTSDEMFSRENWDCLCYAFGLNQSKIVLLTMFDQFTQ